MGKTYPPRIYDGLGRIMRRNSVSAVTEIIVSRERQTADATIGRLIWGTEALYRTLEDIQRPVKIAGKTAIPCGRYQVVINNSQRFKKRLPLLLNVPGFEGVRIHAGNTSADTEGCILLGTMYQDGMILNSRIAVNDFMGRLEQALEKGKVWLTVENHVEPS